jgi:adenylate cyclase
MAVEPLAIPLERLARCFEAVIPAMFATCSPDGVPNVIAVSYVHRIDERHVALSRQFFRKTHANLVGNPRASVAVMDPANMDTFRLALRFDHEETSGALFDVMATRVQAVASLTGMAGVFRLQAVDVFEVLSVEQVPGVLTDAPPALPTGTPLAALDGMTQLRTLRRISDCLRAAHDAETLLDDLLGILDEALGFEHSMILLLDETGRRLYTVASRGYGQSGVGAEVGMGDGIIGTVAQTRRPLRLASLGRALRYSRAVRSSARDETVAEIPLPGLVDAESALALPLIVKDELFGVLAVESRRQLEFGERDEAFLDVVAGHVAFGLADLARRADEPEPAAAAAGSSPAAPPRPAPGGPVRRFVYYPADDCVFVDGHYLIRNLPGKILWRLLNAHVTEGRRDFSNRELRLDASLGLPPLRDNLESRLILLRKRLLEKCPDVHMTTAGRGRFTLDVRCRLELSEKS